MLSSTEILLVAFLLTLIHLCQTWYLRIQVTKADELPNGIVGLTQDQERFFNILRDPVLLGASCVVWGSIALLVAVLYPPLGVGYSGYFVWRWKPLPLVDVYEEEDEDVEFIEVDHK